MIDVATGTGGGNGHSGERRVLMVSYNYPPIGGYGTVRTTKLARYLPQYGWRPTVLTVGRERTRWGVGDESEGILPGVKVMRAPFPDVLTPVKDLLVRAGVLKAAGPGAETRLSTASSAGAGALEKSVRWLKRWASFPDRYNAWLPFAVWLGIKELRSGRYDAIYSTSPPVIDNLVAAALQRVSGLPWVADFRDPWTQNPHLSFTPLELRLARALEKSVLRRADAIVSVSEPLAELARELHGDRRGGVHGITNAFDPEDYPGEVMLLQGRFVITYAGMFYGSKRDPSVFLKAVEELIDEGAIGADELLVRLYGPRDPVVNEAKAALKYPQILEVNDPVPRREVIERERESTSLLILVWNHPSAAIGYVGKTFEYLGSRRPILAWNPTGGVLARLLEETGAGVSVSDTGELKQALRAWFREYRETGTLAYHGIPQETAAYTWGRNAGLMAQVLDRVASRPQA